MRGTKSEELRYSLLEQTSGRFPKNKRSKSNFVALSGCDDLIITVAGSNYRGERKSRRII